MFKFNLKEKLVFLSLIIRIFLIIYYVLWHYHDERCNHKRWSLSLTSPLAENNRGEGAFQVLQQPVENGCSKKDETLAECLVVSSHVPTLKYEVKQH